MAEGAKVRVVRCPKCGKLLPELPNFTVYQCGSCGATLQAKKQGSETSQSSPAYSDDVKTRVMDSPVASLEKKSIVASRASSETAGEGGRVEAAEQESLRRGGGSSSGNEGGNLPGKDSRSKLQSTQVENGVEQIESRQNHPSKAPIPGLKPNGDKSLVGKEEEEETKLHADSSYSLNKIRQTVKHEDGKGYALQRALRARAEGIGLKAPYPDEGPSSYHSKSSRVGFLEEKIKTRFSNGIENLEQDRAELLRKLDELRGKLKRSGEVTDLPRDRRTSEAAYRVQRRPPFREGFSSSLTRTSSHHLPFAYEHNVEVPSCAIPDAPGYSEHLVPQMLGRAHFQHHVQYPSRPLDNYLYGQFDPDPFISYRHDGLYAQTACTCVHCSTKNWQMPTQSSNATFSNSRASYLPTHPRYHPLKNPSFSSSQDNNQRLANARLYYGDCSSGHQKFQQRATSVKTKGQTYQPIAGAAPFVACYNCVELLKLPQNLSLVVNSKHKLQCGSCSEIISLELDGKKLVISAPSQPTNSITGTHENSNGGILDSSSSQNHSNRHQGISYSEGYESPADDIPSTDEKLVLPSPYSVSSEEAGFKEYGLGMSGPDEVRAVPSSSSSSEKVVSPDSMSCEQDITSSAELPYKTNDTSHVSSAPVHEHLEPPLTNQITDAPGKESRSRRSDQERSLSIGGNFKQTSVKDVPVATEIDVPPDEFLNAGFSQDSFDESKGDDRPKNNKGGESFLAGFIKKSFRDFSRYNSESGRSKVSINGHPVSDRIVMKAEKHAGPIHPGEYWYDYRAGFWGVMGNACLGIIPPFIEEFNYPMPKTCSGGNTGVFVNGRELHPRDLDLLVGRGLPSTSGQSYIIEISGKVWDEDSGEELDSLGKLAPTVEKVKHGFGMRASWIIA